MSGPDAHRLERAVERLVRAARTGSPCEPVRDLIDAEDVGAAYTVQSRVVETLFGDDSPVGHKIGLTSPAVQHQLGVDQPDFGRLYAGMRVADGAWIGANDFLQPRAEGEIAFRLCEDLDADGLTLDDVHAALDAAAPAIEICDSRIRGWDITFVDTVSDNASAGGYALGAWRELGEFVPKEASMTMSVTGRETLRGNGSVCLGDPFEAVLWLARTLRYLGDPLRAGQVVLSGALAPMVDLTPGRRVTVEIAGLGDVSIEREGAPA